LKRKESLEGSFLLNQSLADPSIRNGKTGSKTEGKEKKSQILGREIINFNTCGSPNQKKTGILLMELHHKEKKRIWL